METSPSAATIVTGMVIRVEDVRNVIRGNGE